MTSERRQGGTFDTTLTIEHCTLAADNATISLDGTINPGFELTETMTVTATLDREGQQIDTRNYPVSGPTSWTLQGTVHPAITANTSVTVTLRHQNTTVADRKSCPISPHLAK